MSRSIYLHLAIMLVKADLKREERSWKRSFRREVYDIPWENPHLLRDIGLASDGRLLGYSKSYTEKAERRIHHIRRIFHSSIVT